MVILAVASFLAAPALAQDGGSVRQGTTTFFGDTGLWFVPSGEILPDGKWSASGYRANFDRQEGFTDISHFAVTFAVGVADRVEVFGSVRATTRIDRDFRPLALGSRVNEYPFAANAFSGNQFGDVLVGAKINILSEHRQQAMAFAVRGTAQLPTGDDATGVSTEIGRAHV